MQGRHSLKSYFSLFSPNVDVEKNKQLLEITKLGFYPLEAFQSGMFHNAIQKLLENLNPSDEQFDNNYNRILFGGMVVEAAIETDKYFLIKKLYPITTWRLMDMCGIKKFPDLAMSSGEYICNHPSVIGLINGVGNRVLNGSLGFNAEQLNGFFDTALSWIKNPMPGASKNRDQTEKSIADLEKFKTIITERHAHLFQEKPIFSH